MKFLLLLCCMGWLQPLLAQNDNPVEKLAKEAAQQAQTVPQAVPAAATAPPPAPPDDAQRYYQDLRLEQERNKLLEVEILCGLTLVSLIIVLFYLSRTPGYNSTHMVHATGLIFIISGTIILVIMADTEQQLTAAMGILGAVAGYLFGSMRRGGTSEESAS